MHFNFLPKLFFLEGVGVYIKLVEIGGVEGYFCIQKMKIPGRRGDLHEIPSMVGLWIFSGTTQ